MNIIIIHQLNNFSGSPNVLAVIAKEFVNRGYNVDLITNRTEGFLSDIKGVTYSYVNYIWNPSARVSSAFALLWWQIELFFKILFKGRHNIYYINTITPVGAILACAITGKKYIIHVHENMQKQTFLYKIYRNLYKRFNKKSIFVSKYVQSQAIGVRDSIVAYNGLNTNFIDQIRVTPMANRDTVLMLCSLRPHKGIFEFIEVAKKVPNQQFELVVSESQDDIDVFRKYTPIPENITLFAAQKNVHPFYQRAKVVMNLSRPNEWVETFGLTILEGLSYSIPVIFPNVGGPMEVGQDGVCGFAVDPMNIENVTNKLRLLLENNKLYAQMSHKALERANDFSAEKMVSQIEKYISQ